MNFIFEQEPHTSNYFPLSYAFSHIDLPFRAFQPTFSKIKFKSKNVPLLAIPFIMIPHTTCSKKRSILLSSNVLMAGATKFSTKSDYQFEVFDTKHLCLFPFYDYHHGALFFLPEQKKILTKPKIERHVPCPKHICSSA